MRSKISKQKSHLNPEIIQNGETYGQRGAGGSEQKSHLIRGIRLKGETDGLQGAEVPGRSLT